VIPGGDCCWAGWGMMFLSIEKSPLRIPNACAGKKTLPWPSGAANVRAASGGSGAPAISRDLARLKAMSGVIAVLVRSNRVFRHVSHGTSPLDSVPVWLVSRSCGGTREWGRQVRRRVRGENGYSPGWSLPSVSAKQTTGAGMRRGFIPLNMHAAISRSPRSC